MAIDYSDIIDADLSALSTASSAWKKMSERYDTLCGHYRDHVKGAVDADTWRGYSVFSYKDQSKTTLELFEAGKAEALAVSGQLDEAHRTLSACKRHVESERDAAKEAGMEVDSNGRCRMNLDKLPEDKAETYRTNHVARQETEEAWSDRIAKAVEATRVEDRNIKRGMLLEPPHDGKGVPGGFNGSLRGDIGAANAQRADELYTKVKDGQKLNGDERTELNSIVAANKKDPEFSRTLLDSLGGPKGLIQTHNALDDLAYYDAKGDKKDYLKLDRGLATALASATSRDSDGGTARPGAARAYAHEWREQMRKVGVQKFDLELAGKEGGGQQVRGYQSLVSLMQKSDDTYEGYFLHGLADDIRAAEDPGLKKGGDRDIWDLEGDFHGKQKDGVWDHSGNGRFANDPLDGVLDVMSKNPEAATEYLDPGTEDGKDRLDYLKNDRDWKLVNNENSQVSPQGQVQIVTGPDSEAPDARSGYGAALEAAATGNVPGAEAPKGFSDHSAAETRVFQEMVNSYGADAKEDSSSIPGPLRQHMANAVAYYPDDVHDILGKDVDYSNPHNKTEPNDVSVDDKRMQQFLRGLSEDGGAFRTIHDSQAGHIAEDVESLGRKDFEENSTDAKRVSRESGRTMGTLDEIRADVLGSDRDAEIDRNNWKKTYQYHAFGAPITNLPVAGDSLQRLVDIGTGKYAEALNDEVTNRTREQLIEHYSEKGYPRLRDMLEERARQTGVPQHTITDTGGPMGDLRSDANGWYNNAIGNTKGATGNTA